MNAPTFNRLHTLRMENDAARFTMEELRPRFDRLAHRHANGTAPRAVTAHQLFQTPPEIAAQLVALLNLQPGARVLEPSAGLGRLLDALTSGRRPLASEVVAIELAPQCARELYEQNRPGVKILQRDFLECLPGGPCGTHFDAIAMNPPFHLRADIRHIQHALTFLKPGGTLAALCLDTPERARALRPLTEPRGQWIKLGAGKFRQEGTHVPVVLLSITAPA